MFPTVTNNFDNLHQKKCWVLILIRLKSVHPSTTAASPADPGASFTRPAQTMARKQAHAVAAAGSREAAPHIAAPALAVNPPPPNPHKKPVQPPYPLASLLALLPSPLSPYSRHTCTTAAAAARSGCPAPHPPPPLLLLPPPPPAAVTGQRQLWRAAVAGQFRRHLVDVIVAEEGLPAPVGRVVSANMLHLRRRRRSRGR